MPRKLDAWPVDAWKRILNQSKFSPFLNALILLYPFWLVLEPNTVPNLYFLSKNSTRGKTCIVVNLFFIVHNLTEFCDKIDQNWFIPFRVHPIFVTKIDFFWWKFHYLLHLGWNIRKQNAIFAQKFKCF